MNKFIQDLFTGKDGDSWSLGRFAWFLSLITFLVVVAYKAFHEAGPFDMQSFGIGLGAVFAVGPIANGIQAKLGQDDGV